MSPALISTAAQCRALDAAVIDGLGVPGIALMELASHGVARVVLQQLGDATERVLVVCGAGNNGGDGYAVARWLALDGVDVSIWALDSPRTADALTMRSAAQRLGLRFVDAPGQPTLIVDAIFGTGLAREITGRYAQAIEALQKLDAKVVAVDLPSGVHADTGAVLGVALPAQLTVSFGRLKQAFFSPGASLCGDVQLVDIGTHRSDHSSARLAERASLAWPTRPRDAHKNRLGHLAVVAGSEAMAGAAVLACMGAVRSGVGLVTLLSSPRSLPRLGALPPGVMLRTGTLLECLERSKGFDAVAVGPGIGGGAGLSAAVLEALERLWASATPAVFDADALQSMGQRAHTSTVFTPHPGEAGRLLGSSAQAVQSDRFSAARSLAQLGGVALLKGRHTLVCEGGDTTVNPTGSPTLATAGSGDVLTGLIGGLLARGLAPADAARTGAWVHGRAGQILEAERLEGWSAVDIAEALPLAMAELS